MLFEAFHNRLIVTGELVCQTAVRIGAGRSTEPIGTDLPVIKDGQRQPFIPGSSLKGVMRSGAESFVRAISDSPKAACNPVGKKDEWCVGDVSDLSDDETDKVTDEDIYRATCLVCRTFGSPWFASKVQVRDALLAEPELWFDQFQVRNGVAIDRDTLTASQGKLYDYEVVPAQTRFAFQLTADNLTPDQIGMLLMALRPFERAEISIGGGRSRGLGAVALENYQRKLFSANGDIEKLFQFLADDQTETVWEPLTDEKDYLKAFRDKLVELVQGGGEAHA